MACPDANNVPMEELDELDLDIPEDLPPAQWPECCIYRVPKKLRELNNDAYTPKQISIGPFHQGNPDLSEMENSKKRYYKGFCCRTYKSPEDLKRDLASIIAENELKIRRSYSENPKHSRNEFIKMILLDAIFIIELVLRNFEMSEEIGDDYILSNPLLRNTIQLDLILLENQLPFFILEDLYECVFNDSSSYNHHKEKQQKQNEIQNKVYISFLKLCRIYFSCYEKKQPMSKRHREVKHFTDLARYSQIADNFRPRPGGKIRYLYCATKLDKAGMKFKAVQGRSLLDIKLRIPFFDCSWLLNCLPCLKCVPCFKHMQPLLELPVFEVGDATECVFRNLTALEQCHYPKQAYICSYILLLDYLINTEEDVHFLVERKVIVNRLDRNAVATLVSNLRNQIVESKSCYFDLSEVLNEHCENFWNRNIAPLTAACYGVMRSDTTKQAAIATLGVAL